MRKRVIKTRLTVIIPSRIRCVRSSLILSDWSTMVRMRSLSEGGIIQVCWRLRIFAFPSVTRLTIEPHLFFTTQSVTAGSEGCQEIEVRESEVIFLGTSFTSATSLR